MLGHKMVPKYMKELELKSDLSSYKRDENKCIASGQRALLNYNRVVKSNCCGKVNNGNITFYIMKTEEDVLVKEKHFDLNARAVQRKKETSI